MIAKSRNILKRRYVSFLLTFCLLINSGLYAYPRGKYSLFSNSEIPYLLLIVCIVILFSISILLLIRLKKTNKFKKKGEIFKSIYENALIGLYRTTPEGKIIYANSTVANIFGLKSTEELININLNEYMLKFEVEYNRKLFMEKIETNGSVKGFRSILKNENGELIYITESARKVIGEDGNTIYYDGMIEDITEKKNDEEELSRYIEELLLNKDLVEQNAKEFAELSEKLAESEEQLREINRSKDKFFSIISHDLRSPFNSLIGFSDLLVRDFDNFQPEEVKSVSQNINQSIKNLFRLIENLLQWSGLQTGKMRRNPSILNLHCIVSHIFDLLRGNALKKNISIINETEPEINIYADEFMVNSIIQNLVSNAIKFTKAGGSVKISTEILDEFVEVTISDTGVGINQECVDKLFRIDSNLSTKGTSGEPGTGLGLILCKELVEKNRGKIRVESQVGKGTSFIFTFPYVKNVETFREDNINISTI